MAKIQFVRSWDTAKQDKAIFNDWQRKAITTRKACILLAINNRLDFVSEDDFLETAESLGYRQNRFNDYYDDEDDEDY